jgi:hypothetical protein
MVAKITFFPVDNGDMTLIKLDSGRTILIDVKIRTAADDTEDDTPDVASKLRERLQKDQKGRYYVDVFLLTHPDQDHCSGLSKHFHLGSPSDYSKKDDKIFVREIWSSPIIFRRKERRAKAEGIVLCDDAQAFWSEARRRVAYFRDHSKSEIGDGNRILILGEDEDGKTDNLSDIVIKIDELITTVNGEQDSSMTARLLGPLPKSNDEDEEEALEKNRSSVILAFSFNINQTTDVCRFLTGGDAEVAVWERLWKKHKDKDWLQYHILQTPHHCSWRSLSSESWSDLGEKAKINQDALNALSQAKNGAHIIASSKPVKAEDSDPPCIRAKREYEAIVNRVSGVFKCTGEYPTESNPDVMEFEITENGPRPQNQSMKASAFISSGAIGKQPLSHG